jgi:hypothetical protein
VGDAFGGDVYSANGFAVDFGEADFQVGWDGAEAGFLGG